MGIPEHPDIARILRDGHPRRQISDDMDSPEMRAEFLRNYDDELVEWVKKKHPDLIDDWLKEAGYDQWLKEG